MADLLTSLDVVNKSFKKSMRGYDAAEVDEFLDQLAETLQVYAQKTKDLERELLAKTDSLDEYEKMKSVLHEALLVAQKSADEKVYAAKAEAERIVAEAMEKADAVCHEAEEEVDRLRQDIGGIRDVRMQYEQEFRGMLAKFDTMLNQMIATSTLDAAVEAIVGTEEEYAEEAQPDATAYMQEEAPQSDIRREDLENAFNVLGVNPKDILDGNGREPNY
ncbi:DivIVA domain-containing protein [Synergistaceae bacterium OttesenSCG-928-D05]|nr:DivIVA domain-containing protein [Synergistaceae bacterium OttesenSCG-928-D05]